MKPEARRVVFDTNAVVSAFLFRESVPGKAMSLAELNCTLLYSKASLDEVRTVLSRPKFDRYVSPVLRSSYLRRYEAAAQLIDIKSSFKVCRDPLDNQFLELAVDGDATAIVTGDEDLLQLDPFRNVRILTPKDFLGRFSDVDFNRA